MNFIKLKAENDKIYSDGNYPDMKSEYIADFTPVPQNRPDVYTVAANTVRATTIEAALRYSGGRVIALSFANALVPGGAYIMGGNAQEESLCRASLLYYTIRDVREFYSANRRHIIADYTDGMIYSSNVPIIRNDSGRLLDSPVVCDFITCPAVNRYEAFMIPRSKTNMTMERRIEKIVSLAQSKSPDVIILGAFGCGAFGNRREDVLPMFERAINRYSSGQAEIIFAEP